MAACFVLSDDFASETCWSMARRSSCARRLISSSLSAVSELPHRERMRSHKISIRASVEEGTRYFA
jgi:hypothetical protein